VKAVVGVINAPSNINDITGQTDFDGDSINFTLAIDNLVANGLRHLDPHKSVFGLANPDTIEDTITIPKPVIGMISGWMSDKEIVVDTNKQLLMQQLLT